MTDNLTSLAMALYRLRRGCIGPLEAAAAGLPHPDSEAWKIAVCDLIIKAERAFDAMVAELGLDEMVVADGYRDLIDAKKEALGNMRACRAELICATRNFREALGSLGHRWPGDDELAAMIEGEE